MKVYIVTDGEYSDYHICNAFKDRETAEIYCALGHGRYVEEYDMAESAEVNEKPEIMYRFHVQYPSWKADQIGEPKYVLASMVEAEKEAIREQAKRLYRKPKDIRDMWHPDRFVFLRKNEPELALKIVRDRIAKAKAEREGI